MPSTKRHTGRVVPAGGEVEFFHKDDKAAALSRLVRGFRRGNNANNTNLSPLTMNANNAPSNANTNIGFGKYCAKQMNISPRGLDLRPKRQVQSLADVESRTSMEKVLRPPADRANE